MLAIRVALYWASTIVIYLVEGLRKLHAQTEAEEVRHIFLCPRVHRLLIEQMTRGIYTIAERELCTNAREDIVRFYPNNLISLFLHLKASKFQLWVSPHGILTL